MSYRPRFDNGAAWRTFAVLNFILLPFLLVYAIIMHGIPVLWEDLPFTVRMWSKVLWTGRPGPYNGVIW